MSETTATIILCRGSGTECWCCGGSVYAEGGPFDPDPRYCSQDCHDDWEAHLYDQQVAHARRFGCCPECGFDNEEHMEGCSKPPRGELGG